MARDETPPFVRGGTWYNGGTIDPTNLGGTQLEGKEYRFEDVTYGTGMYVTVRVLRNSATFNLLPGQVATFDATAYGRRCNGLSAVTSAPAIPVDEFLPAAGVAPNDLFYGIMEGPCKMLTPLDAGADNVIAVGDPLAAITAATTGATTAGRVATIFSGSTNGRDSNLNCLGRAMSAATTANTNTSLLVFATRWL